MAQTTMTVRLDSVQKAQFDQLCEQFGMSANTAINIFVRTVIRRETHKRPELTLEEINAEINAVREAKANKV
ncbi:MAG: type II toxin-antitoxin system RelB/DinJ family antitoxin [Bacteroides sp.]